MPEQTQSEEPRKDKDLNEILDLNRTELTRQMVAQMAQAMHDIQSAQDDLKEIVASARGSQFTRREIAAMKTVARLRMKDQLNDAQEKLEALERISNAVGCPLFAWAAAQG